MRRSTLLVLLPAALVLAACGGSGTKGHGVVAAAHGGGNVAAFCADYTAAAQAYQDTLGDVTDPSFPQFLSLLTKAQAEAPAAVAAPVSAMLRVARAVQHSNGSGDLTAYSATINAWAATHCPQGGTSSPPAATDSPTDSTTPAGQASLAGFCADVGTVTQNLDTLNNRAIEGGSAAPSTAEWQAAATTAHNLAAEAPATDISGSSKTRDDATSLAGDVEDVVTNGFEGSDGGANLLTDLSIVQADAQLLSCPASK